MRNCLESAVLNQFPFPGPKAPQSESDIWWLSKKCISGQGQVMEAASGVLDWGDWAVNCTLTHRAFWTSARCCLVFSLSYYDQGSQEYADHLRNTITEMLSIMMGVWPIKLLMPFRILNKGHHHHGASQHPSAVKSVFSLLYIHLFTSSVFRSRGKVSKDPMHNQWWVEFRCQRWLAPH